MTNAGGGGGGRGEKGDVEPRRWDRELVQPRGKTVWRIPQKLKIELPYDPGIPLPEMSE